MTLSSHTSALHFPDLSYLLCPVTEVRFFKSGLLLLLFYFKYVYDIYNIVFYLFFFYNRVLAHLLNYRIPFFYVKYESERKTPTSPVVTVIK